MAAVEGAGAAAHMVVVVVVLVVVVTEEAPVVDMEGAPEVEGSRF